MNRHRGPAEHGVEVRRRLLRARRLGIGVAGGQEHAPGAVNDLEVEHDEHVGLGGARQQRRADVGRDRLQPDRVEQDQGGRAPHPVEDGLAVASEVAREERRAVLEAGHPLTEGSEALAVALDTNDVHGLAGPLLHVGAGPRREDHGRAVGSLPVTTSL